MTLQDPASQNAAAAQRAENRRKNRPSVEPTEALESMLVNAHRIAITLSDLTIFQEISVAEWALLKSLGDRQRVPLKEISAAAGLSRQRLRKLVIELQRKGLVSTERAEGDDKRLKTISATPLAAKVLSLISLKMKELFPDDAKETSKMRQSRSLVGAARSMQRVVKSMRRSWRPKKGKGRRAKAEAAGETAA
jgi:DNA-binding MarR family transcriptional regulator